MRGSDVAGTVEAVGKNVTSIQVGDEVFGGGSRSTRWRKAGNVAPKPGNVTFEQAAAVPMAGLVAIQDLRDHGKVRPGQRDERYDLILDNVVNQPLRRLVACSPRRAR